MTTRNLLAGFRDEIEKIAAVKKKTRAASVAQLTKGKSSGEKDKETKSKMELGKRWRAGSPFAQQTDDPRDIAVPYERDGTSASHVSPEASNSENDEGSR